MLYSMPLSHQTYSGIPYLPNTYPNGKRRFKTTGGIVLSAGESVTGLPGGFMLEQNYPNPFNPPTTISFTLAKAGDITLRVFDILGREVSVLAKGRYTAGHHTVTWSAHGVASGVYFYVLQTSEGFLTRKLMVLR